MSQKKYISLWFQLLHDWKWVVGRTGFTFPYLIGAMRESQDTVLCSQDDAEDALFALLIDMCDITRGSHIVRKGRCKSLHEPIAELYAAGERYAEAVPIKSAKTGAARLHVEPAYIKRERDPTVESVFDRLKESVVNEIMAGRFSFISKQEGYGPFTKQELEFISRTRGEPLTKVT
jgi:hypothetical protein